MAMKLLLLVQIIYNFLEVLGSKVFLLLFLITIITYISSIARTQKETANSKLAVHDWMITRKAEKSTDIPSSVTTYRDAVRTKCGEIETALNGASDLAAFMALFQDERNADGSLKTVAKINDWPDEI
mgnify:CR=1 FL=1